MNNIHNDILYKILNNIEFKTCIRYIPIQEADGEQNHSIFYKNYYPYILVNKLWYSIIKNDKK